MFLYNLEPVKRSRIVSYCYQNWKIIYYSIEPEDVVSLGSQRLLFDDKSMIAPGSRELTFEKRVLKRLMDIIVSAIGLVIASPIMPGDGAGHQTRGSRPGVLPAEARDVCRAHLRGV